MGSVVKFDTNSEDEYKVIAIETDVTIAVKQEQTLTINTANDGDYIVNITDGAGVLTQVSYTADVTTNGDTVNDIAASLGTLLENYDVSATNISVTDNVITISASIPGVPMNNAVYSGDMTLVETVASVPGDSYELVFDLDTDFAAMNLDGKVVLIKDSALNALVVAPKEGTVVKTANELKSEVQFISNETEYELLEGSIPLYQNDKLKFTAKSSGALMNGVQIAIAREADFASGTQNVFPGLILNDFFETKPSEAQKEIALIIKQDEVIKAYIVSLVPGSKDFRNKSNYIEDIINTYDDLVYVKDNVSIVEMPATRLYTASQYNDQGILVVPSVDEVLRLSNGSDGDVQDGNIAEAYGDVNNNTIFGKPAYTSLAA